MAKNKLSEEKHKMLRRLDYVERQCSLFSTGKEDDAENLAKVKHLKMAIEARLVSIDSAIREHAEQVVLSRRTDDEIRPRVLIADEFEAVPMPNAKVPHPKHRKIYKSAEVEKSIDDLYRHLLVTVKQVPDIEIWVRAAFLLRKEVLRLREGKLTYMRAKGQL